MSKFIKLFDIDDGVDTVFNTAQIVRMTQYPDENGVKIHTTGPELLTDEKPLIAGWRQADGYEKEAPQSFAHQAKSLPRSSPGATQNATSLIGTLAHANIGMSLSKNEND